MRAGVVGGAGYTGGELIRILIGHPQVDILFVHSKSNAGKFIHEVHADLLGETDLVFSSELNDSIDVLFLCVGHGEAKKFLEENEIPKQSRVIDLSQDFRLGKNGQPAKWDSQTFVYGLPEINREAISNANRVANPGCFATAIQLGLLPLAKAGLLNQVYSTGITGSTGAGQGLSPTTHFSWRANNIQAYKTLSHQHIKEIYQSLHQLQETFPASVQSIEDGFALHFVPWRGDFTRGIFVSSQLHCDWSEEKLQNLFESFYADHPFTVISREPISLKQVVNTNKCCLHLEKVGNMLVVHSVIDNLLKGASGQAVQNMNLMFGLDESSGLRLKASYF
ncbi:MAG: N-acetyl-gamma-glutamyl-phosphate reductase [Chitinophagales bacterium]